MQLYCVMVSQVLLHGSPSWNLTVAQLEQLEVLQRHQLRHVLGVRCSDRLTNGDLLHQPTIEAQLRRGRVHWTKHMLRMDDGRLSLQLLDSRLPGRKPQGGHFQTLVSLYAADVQSTFDSQRWRDVAGIAAKKNV